MLALPSNEPPDFYIKIPVFSHVVKKNNRPIQINPRTGRRFLGKNAKLISAEHHLLRYLLKARNTSPINLPIIDPIAVCFRFTFSDFFTKDGCQRKTIPDLSNLYQLIEDQLQKSGIIQNDSQIFSHDGSRRVPGPVNMLEIWLWRESVYTKSKDDGQGCQKKDC